MKIIVKNKKDKKKEKLMNEILQIMLKDYPDFEKDIMQINADIMMFKIKYGIDIKELL